VFLWPMRRRIGSREALHVRVVAVDRPETLEITLTIWGLGGVDRARGPEANFVFPDLKWPLASFLPLVTFCL